MPRPLLSLSAAAFLALSFSTLATERRFAFTYETTTSAKGAFELENWVTWSHFVQPGKNLDFFQFRHEIEYGVTDRLQASLYVFDWDYSSITHGTRYEHSGIEL